MTPTDVILDAREGHPGFNFEFLIFLIISGLLAIFFLLYFNRLFASIISYAVRTYTWHTYRVYIDVKAIQISLLGGRIFFTGLRYHGPNETFLVHHGDITWQYWLRRVREVDVQASDKQKNSGLPCRIHVKLVGVEWFVYNRSPAYDSVLAGLTDDISPGSGSSDIFNEKDETVLRSRKGYQNGLAENIPSAQIAANATDTLHDVIHAPSQQPPSDQSSTTSRSIDDAIEDVAANSLPSILQFFPIHVECQKPAVVVGNDNTKAILIVKANSANTIVDASQTKTCDLYRQLFKVEFDHPVVEMRENDEFKEHQDSRATRQREDASNHDPPAPRSFFRFHRRKVLNSLRSKVPYWRRSVESFSTDSRGAVGTGVSQVPGSNRWQGLSRYLDDRYQDDKARWSSIEYAAVTTILDSPSAVFTIYWDAVSKVTDGARRHSSSSFHTSINGTEPPAWGMSLSVKGGTMNYGPWADRMRADLQRVFYPTLSKDAKAAEPLASGSWRVPTQFKLFVDLEDAVTLRIPIREESKNWRWRGKEPPMGRKSDARKHRQKNKKNSKGDAQPVRPAGWLEIKVPSNSTISYSMDMLAQSTGYQNHLDIDLPSTELWSSVNHDLLWKSGAQRINCDLSNPLGWNTLRTWYFNITCDEMKLYLLRDHIFLLIDLVDDWASGPPSEYLVFTPYIYSLNLSLHSLQLYLNVNDENIIDKATALDDNSYLIISSPLLKVKTSIPLEQFRPNKNAIPFDIRADTFDLSSHTPQSDTQAAFLNSNELGHGEDLTVTGSYQYNATTSPANTDTLILNILGKAPQVYLYGFIVRYVILLKDNYFGDHVHFRTLDEYQEQLQLESRKPNPETVPRPPLKKSNDLDIIMSVKLDTPRIMLPVNLYSVNRYIHCEFANLSVDLRFTNYYMDLELLLSPLSLSLGNPVLSPESEDSSYSNTQLFIDGVRVFGHRAFGLPPSEPTYLCNWDVSVGMVDGECTVDFLSSLAKGGAAFGFMFDDVENALVPYSSLVFHDVTFVRIDVASVHLWLHVDDAAFLLSSGPIEVRSNDWAGSHYSKRANINIPNIEVSCVNAESAARHTSRRRHPVRTAAYLKTDIRLASVGRKFHFHEELKIQQALLRREDQRTERTPFLFRSGVDYEFVPEPIEPPAQCAPPPACPMVKVEEDDELSNKSPETQPFSSRLRRQSSFWSFSSSSNSSFRFPGSRPRSRARSSQTAVLSTHSSGTDKERRVSGQRGSVLSSDLRITAMERADRHQPWSEKNEHSSVAFSSQYFTPHFPLEDVQPDERDATFEEAGDENDDGFFVTEALLDDIDPESLSEDHSQASTMVEFPTGVTAFINPEAVRYANSLLAALQPSEPDDILDSLQVDAIGQIFSEKKNSHITGFIQELLVKLPKANIRFLNSSSPNSWDTSQAAQDQYDIRISKTLLITRTVKDRVTETPTSRTSLQFRLKSLELSASERLSTIEPPQAAVMVNIDDVNVSLGAKEITYFDADIGSIVGSTASGKVEYLASLIHRTGNIASELTSLLSETASRHENRVKNLTYKLLEEGQAINDPPFLIRPSAVLRSAHEHMRTVDSWKLIMRLRQIWSTLSQDIRSELTNCCQDSSVEVPPDAAKFVVAAFQKWRSWDLEDSSKSTLLQKIFGQELTSKDDETQQYPILGACRLSELQFVLDPDPKQNKIGLFDLNLRVDKRPAGQVNVLPEINNFHGPLTTLNLCCGDVAIHLNWELCELLEDVLRLHNKSRPLTSNKAQVSAKQPKDKTPAAPGAYHVVLEVSRGSVKAETINLTARSDAVDSKMSVLLCDTGEELSVANAILSCRTVASRLQSHGHLLSIFKLQNPSVFAAQKLQKTASTATHVIQASASSQDLQFEVKQDPVGLLEILDLLIRDEIARLYRLKDLVPSSPQEPKKREKIKEQMSTFVVDVAMFLDSYTISMPLLQSLTYKISGLVARACCNANFGREITFDFDIGENSHEMQINVKNEPRSISLLRIPPAKGRIMSHVQSTGYVVEVLASMEIIRLDASAIYSLLTALNRPQISGAIEEVQQQVNAIQNHMSEAFGPQTSEDASKPASAAKSTLTWAYNIHLALAGVEIAAKTSLKSIEEPTAQILLALDKVTLRASNQHDPSVPPLKYPDLYVNLRHIRLDISRGKKDALRSCGNLTTGIHVSASSRRGDDGKEDWSLHFRNDDLTMNLSPETVSTVIDVTGYMGSKIRDLDTSRELEYLRKLRQNKPKIKINDEEGDGVEETDLLESVLSSITYRFELRNIRFCWDVADETADEDASKEDLVLAIKLIEFGTRTRKSARLTIKDFLLQTVPLGQDKAIRSLHSALLPEVMFNVAYISFPDARRMAFQAVGDSLDLRLTSGFILPAANLIQSISLSMKNVQTASAQWTIENPAATEASAPKVSDEPVTPSQQRSMFGNKRLESLLVDADFAGAVVYVSTKRNVASAIAESKYSQPSLAGKYGQFSADDSGSGAVLRSPGLAWKAEYRDNGKEDPSLYGEININASSNILYPSVVPLVLDILSSVKKVVSDDDDMKQQPKQAEQPKLKLGKSGEEDNFLTSDPSAVLGRLRLNLGLRICRQEFSLSCQPIARVSATTCFDGMYFTLNTVTSQEQGNFFAISGVITKPRASVQHVYSRDSTASFELDSVTISFMNSKHFSGTSGVSAILNVSPMKVSVNAKQVQDFLLFREIWYPEEIRQKPPVQVPKMPSETSQAHLVQRYQEVAATAAFPWTATISIAALDVSVDLGQTIGKSIFQINEFWISSKKTSDWEQNLCLGFKKIGVDCTGRLSGFVALQDFKLRTSIHWPRREEALNETPLVQASLAFNAMRIKAAFDYQAFLVADITSLELLMYNVREKKDGNADRLVAIFDGEAVQIFGTTTSVAQGVSLYQALQKLIQERRENFESSLKEIEKFMKRKSVTLRGALPQPSPVVPKMPVDDTLSKSPISLDTDVVVTLKALNLGVFPSTFSDHQVFKMEALNAYARFAASIEQRRIHSILRMTLGQLRIGLAEVRDAEAPKTMSEMTVEDVVKRSTGSRGGTILKVPRVEAVMETWQKPTSNHIDYIFKSSFEGKVEVGWNYSRISYIRGMWANHSKSLEQTWGRQLPMTAVKITGVPEAEGEQQKITAEVNVPQSKYEYLALEPPVIETPQLRDMGEATPPLEWIGLHRERLPNLTHQIVIVSLLELAGEVEDAYSRILGSS
ncbi:Macrophage colony-stimulating factor 1 receptor [Conoideocrella luteorostrata]|uniref:Macrophage colony-stimulating factor 1 receptor n=1 Tax=Conoideocrella luteorostrata TaxID=1105319 RepID=A0AAJ0CXB6_9HYPO|nr:Macrophage colony-stimulating factor 1 receptor [Conoideocrella luteorostrata]